MLLAACVSCKKDPAPQPGPDDPGTEVTPGGDTPEVGFASPFKTVLGKTDEEIQGKLDDLWSFYFGMDNSKMICYIGPDGTEYILDTNNNDVRSVGMAYAMMFSVQLDQQATFDKLWSFVRKYMWNKESSGFVSFKVSSSGDFRDSDPCPDADLYIAASLLFASGRWGDAAYDYNADAQLILSKMWNDKGYPLFNLNRNIIPYRLNPGSNDFTAASMNIPALLDVFAARSDTDKDKFEKAAKAARELLYNAANYNTGLFSEVCNFDGTPKSDVFWMSGSARYMYEAPVASINVGMDYYLTGKDTARQTEICKRFVDFYKKDNYSHAYFDWDGSSPESVFNQANAAALAMASIPLMGIEDYDAVVEDNLKRVWDLTPRDGQYRYQIGIQYFMAMIHLCGAFKIW